MVRRAGTGSGHARVKNQEDEKREARKRQELTGQTLVSLTNKSNWPRQTENTGINTQRVIGEDGIHLEGVETSTRTGETDTSLTYIVSTDCLDTFAPTYHVHTVLP